MELDEEPSKLESHKHEGSDAEDWCYERSHDQIRRSSVSGLSLADEDSKRRDHKQAQDRIQCHCSTQQDLDIHHVVQFSIVEEWRALKVREIRQVVYSFP